VLDERCSSLIELAPPLFYNVVALTYVHNNRSKFGYNCSRNQGRSQKIVSEGDKTGTGDKSPSGVQGRSPGGAWGLGGEAIMC